MHHVCLECGQTYAGGGSCLHDGAALTPWGEDPILGQTIGSWRVTRLLGAGGMGRVYRAVHPGIGAKVAIKVLSQEASEDKELVDRFFAEAKTVSHIGHEHIVKVFDFGTLPDRRSYFVMEYLEGASLAAIIRRRGALPLGSLARVMGEVLAALAAAHAKGVVHRDLKPDNIWVTPAGHAKVLDFGIAKLAERGDASRGPTQTGSLLGTPAYMPPEQAAGRPVDARADVYAAGVCLYEGVTGTPPFMATALYELLRKIIQEPPPAPGTLRPGLPTSFEHVVLRALAKDPAQRFQSATEMNAGLASAAAVLSQDAWESLGAGDVGALIPTPTRSGAPAAAPIGHAATAHATQPDPPPTRVPAGNATTHSGTAGELAAQRAPRSPGWRFGLGALALMLVGAAIAVVATRKLGEHAAAKADQPVVGFDAPAPHAGAAPVALKLPPPPDAARAIAEPVKPPTKAPPPDAAPPRAAVAPVKPVRPPKPPTVDPSKLPPPLGGTAIGPASQPTMDQGQAAWNGEGPPPRLQPVMNPAGEPVNIKHVDIQKMIGRAQKLARMLMDDAQLVRIDASYVAPNGVADLTLGASGYAMFHFRSPKRSKRGSVPRGVGLQCKVLVMVNPTQGLYVIPADDHECNDPIIGLPKCTPKEIWQRGVALGAPTDAVAQLAYWQHEGRKKWLFMIASSITQMIEDDCP